MTRDEEYVAAGYVTGYRWKPPVQHTTMHLPAAVVSVSDCLTTFLPADQDPLTAPWHASLHDAINAARQASATPEIAYVLAMGVPASAAHELAALINRWIGDYAHPIQLNLSQPSPTPAGKIQGFEVLGFEAGRFHSWLCYDLYRQAFNELGILVNDRGLLATLLDARRVADMANSNRGTHDGTPEDITWFAAIITEHDTAQHGVVSPEPKDPPTPPGAN